MWFVPAGKSDLTVDALKLHNELQAGTLEVGTGSCKDARMEEEPDEMSQRTSGTFLSGLSDCSNLTFRKVQRFWESNSAAHKEVCTVFTIKLQVVALMIICLECLFVAFFLMIKLKFASTGTPISLSTSLFK